LRDPHFPVAEHGADFQLPAERFNVLGKRAQIKIRSMR
jgi:hypothetical protein